MRATSLSMKAQIMWLQVCFLVIIFRLYQVCYFINDQAFNQKIYKEDSNQTTGLYNNGAY